MVLLSYVLAFLVLGGAIVSIVLYARKKQRAQKRAHEVRLLALAKATGAAAARKKAMESAATQPLGAAAGAKSEVVANASSAPPTALGPPREERECPWCAENILKKARVCKHCGRDVEPLL